MVVLAAAALGLVLSGPAGAPGRGGELARQPYRFDAGPANSVVDARAHLLSPEHMFDPGRGYGWTAHPDRHFTRTRLARSRDSFEIDGVQGLDLGFRALLPSGTWWLTLYVDAGTEDSSTVTISVQDAPVATSWHAFLQTAEPRTAIQRIYRVYHGPVQIDEGDLRFRLVAGADTVRLLGFSLIPDPSPASPRHRQLLDRIGEAGGYGTEAALEPLIAELDALLAADPADAFGAYWREQLSLLAGAEQDMNMMGWEWATQQTGLGIFDRFHQAVMILDGLLGRPDAEAYPLYERALWQRGRLLYWLGRERGGPNEIAGGARDLAALYARHPGDSLLAMYNGEKVSTGGPCDRLRVETRAPRWSASQLEALCRLREIAHWWVNERQAPNGEFGGKLGDDVELLRFWPPLVLSGDSVALAGLKRLADGVWESDEIDRGYARDVSDVEHASEFIADTAPQLVLYTDEPEYLDRLRYSAEHFADLWTARTPYGRRYFRSAWFSATEVDTLPPRNRDLEMNTRAAKAVRYYAWKTGDESVTDLLHEWSRAWVHAAFRTDKGKPSGVVPASIRFPDEAVNGPEPTWYEPNMYWSYFDWSHNVGSMMLDQLLFTYTLTGDDELFRPLIAALDLIRSTEAAEGDAGAHGSGAWAAAQLRDHNKFWSVVEQWRLYTGDARFDDLLLQYGTPYVRYRITGDETHLVNGLEPMLETIRYNMPLLTSEVLHTDRVYVSPRNGPGYEHLQAMLTADGIPENMSPYSAASWEYTTDTFTALVTDSGKDRLGVQIFDHADAVRPVTIRLWQLQPGTYRLRVAPEGRRPSSQDIAVRERGQRLLLHVPGSTLTRITLKRVD